MEVWKDVPGWEGLYQASDLGRVRSLDRVVWNGKASYTKKGRVLKGTPNPGGYLYMYLSGSGGKVQSAVHQVVAATYLGAPPEGADTMHLDGVKTNNAPANLRYGTRKCNMAFCLDHGTHNRGERCGTAKLTEKDVVAIKKMLDKGFSQAQIAKSFNVVPTTISHIKCGRNWSHIT